ncbi:MAG: hypothetical protein MMC23_000745 [Stictis urceolatum]|nr:hypothetical protein [Stictis urceolata]
MLPALRYKWGGGQLVYLFTCLDTQADCFLDDKPPIFATRPEQIGSQLQLDNSLGRPPLSLSAAIRRLHSITTQVAIFLIKNHNLKHRPTSELPIDVLQEYRIMLSSLLNFDNTFETISKRAIDLGSGKDQRSLKLLSIQQKALRFLVENGFSDRPTGSFDLAFEAILDTVEEFVDTEAQSPRNLVSSSTIRRESAAEIAPSFTLDAEIIPTLYLTAFEAQSWALRLRAIRMLRSINI